jgi:hypothetical protein
MHACTITPQRAKQDLAIYAHHHLAAEVFSLGEIIPYQCIQLLRRHDFRPYPPIGAVARHPGIGQRQSFHQPGCPMLGPVSDAAGPIFAAQFGRHHQSQYRF